MKFALFNKPQTKNSQMTQEQHNQIVNELIRQSQLEYNMKIAIGTTSAILTFASIILFYNGQIPQTHLNIGIGVMSSLVGFKSASDSKKELKELLENSKI
ncbi:MAG: TRADD-N-associated membrane domain-containing protein, partial [Dolichospermum sp.]